jgi:NAD(P)-dependent dehydrogenase (short-subunit alcohol dehydrogenase family)
MKTFLVQGAGGGIGGAIARALLERRDAERLVATARDPQRRPELMKIAETSPGRVLVLPLDVTEEASIRAAADSISDQCSRLHGVFNCSGVLHDHAGLQPEKKIEDLALEPLARSFAVNAIGPALVVRHLLPLLRHDERCVVANISARVGSIADNRLGGWYGYRSSKAALNMLTRTLAIELQRRAPNVICVALHPGTVDTALSKPFQRRVDPAVLAPPDEAAERLLNVVDGLAGSDTGSFRSWDGSELPW